jgi:hypothetical protein
MKMTNSGVRGRARNATRSVAGGSCRGAPGGLGQNLPSVQKQLYRPAALRLPTVREPLFGFEDSRSEPVLESLPRFRTLFAKESRSLRFRGLLILP